MELQETKLSERILRLALENDLTYEAALELYCALVMADQQVIAWCELFPDADSDSVSWRPDGEGVFNG